MLLVLLWRRRNKGYRGMMVIFHNGVPLALAELIIICSPSLVQTSAEADFHPRGGKAISYYFARSELASCPEA